LNKKLKMIKSEHKAMVAVAYYPRVKNTFGEKAKHSFHNNE